jgi:hypothetical protein
MKNLVMLILMLVGIAFIGKVVVEKHYEGKLDEAIVMIRGFVDIRYQDIKMGLDGSIVINSLNITPAGLDESIDIASIKAIASDPMFPLKGLDIFLNGKFPDTFELSFQGLSMPIRLVEESQKAYFKNLSKGQECRNLASSFNYTGAGYSRIDSDIRVAFDFSDADNATVNVEIFDQISSTTLEWVFNANEIQNVVTRQSDQLPVSRINVAIELEPAAAEKFVNHCAKVFSITPEVYLQKVVGSAKYSQNTFGADLGVEMRTALVAFMKGGAQFSISSKPSSQLKKFELLQFYTATDILRWMNLSISLDGKKLALYTSVFAKGTDSEPQSEDVAISLAPQANVKYFSALASNADRYFGRRVIINRTDQRKPIAGKLTGIDANDRLMVKSRRYGGSMVLTVGVEEIEKFQVFNNEH